MRKFLFVATAFLSVQISGQKPELMLPIGHTMQITGVRFSRSGDQIMSGSIDKTVKIWDRASGKLLRSFDAPSFINLVQYSPDNKIVAAGLADNSVRIWDVRTGKVVKDIKEYTEGGNGEMGCKNIDFSSDGKQMLVVSDFGIIKLWDTRSWKLIRDFSSLKAREGKFLNDEHILLITSFIDKDTNLEHNYHVASLVTGKKTIYKSIDPVHRKYAGEKEIHIAETDAGITLFKSKTGEKVLHIPLDPKDDPLYVLSNDGSKLFLRKGENESRIWDVSNKKEIRQLPEFEYLEVAEFSPDGRYFVIAQYNEIILWDIEKSSAQKEFKALAAYNSDAQYAPDNRHFIISHEDGSISIFDRTKASLVTKLNPHSAPVVAAQFSLDGKFIVSISYDSTITLYNQETKEMVRFHLLFEPMSVLFSPRNNYLVIAGHKEAQLWTPEGKLVGDLLDYYTDYASVTLFTDDEAFMYVPLVSGLRIWETGRGNLLTPEETDSLKVRLTADEIHRNLVEYEEWGVEFHTYSRDRKFLLTVQGVDDPTADVYSTQSGKKIYTLRGHRGVVFCGAFSPDGKYIATGASDNTIRLWDFKTGRIIRILTGHSSSVISVAFSNDSREIISVSNDHTTRIWRVKDGRPVVNTVTLPGTNYFMQTPQGYYLTTKEAAQQLHFSSADLRIISFSQLDVRYNRPDKVLQEMGKTDTLLIASYRRAYEKRIRKLGIDTSNFRDSFSLPDAAVTFISNNEVHEKTGSARIRLQFSGKNVRLARFNAWINDVPLFGMKGIDLRSENRFSLDTALTIPLSMGDNVIEASVTDANGTESYRSPLFVRYDHKSSVAGKLYFIGIGINRFQQPGYGLNWSVKDIRDLSTALKGRYGDTILIDTLFDEQVTVENVSALKKTLQTTNVNDKVIIAYSGHGLLSTSFDYYLSTYNVNFDTPEVNGLAYEVLEGLLDSIPARQKLMMIDACHSGEVDKEEMDKYDWYEKNKTDSQARSGRKPIPKESVLGMKNSFQLMQELFVDVGRRTGATVISAAAGTQFALEKSDLQNGVFTSAVLEYMRSNPTVTVSELRSYVNKRVSELTGGLQVPTTRSSPVNYDWKVW